MYFNDGFPATNDPRDIRQELGVGYLHWLFANPQCYCWGRCCTHG
jgi:hypothetical protein